MFHEHPELSVAVVFRVEEVEKVGRIKAEDMQMPWRMITAKPGATIESGPLNRF